MRDQDF